MADDDVLLKVGSDVTGIIKGVEQIQASLKEMADSFMAVAKSMTSAVESIGEAIENTGKKSKTTGGELDTASGYFQKWIGKALNAESLSVTFGQQMSKGLDSVMGGLKGVVTAFPNMVSQVAAAGDAAQTMSNQLGMSVEDLAELQFIADQSGANLQGLARTMQGLGGILADESGKGAKAIEGLGLNIDDLKKKDTKEAFFEIIKGIKDTVPAADQGRVAMEIFGSRFRANTMILKEDIGALMTDFKSLGGGMTSALAEAGDNYGDAMNRVRLVQQNFRNDVAMLVLPTLTEIIKMMPKAGGAVLVLGESIIDLAKSFGPLLSTFMTMKAAGMFGFFTKAAEGTKVLTTATIAQDAAQKGMAVSAAAVNATGFFNNLMKWGGRLGVVGAAIWVASEALAVMAKHTEKLKNLKDAEKPLDDIAASGLRVAQAQTELTKAQDEYNDAIAKGAKLYTTMSFSRSGAVTKMDAEFVKNLEYQQKMYDATMRGAEATKIKVAADEAAAKSAAKNARGGLSEIAYKYQEIGEILKRLDPAMKAAIIDLEKKGATAKEIADYLGDEKGLKGKLEHVTGAVEQFKKGVKDTQDALEKTPLYKFTESVKTLSAEMASSRAEGSDSTRIMKDFGKEAYDAYLKAAKVPGALKQFPAAMQEVATSWAAADMAKKAEDFGDKLDKASLSFTKGMVSGARAAEAATTEMATSMATAYMTSAEAAAAAIEKERNAKLAALKASQTDLETSLAAEHERISEAFEARREEMEKLGKDLTDAQKAELKQQEQDMKDKATADVKTVKDALDKQTVQTNEFYNDQQDLRRKDTGDFERNMKAWGITTKKVADDAIKVEQDKLAELKRHTDPFYKAQIDAQQKVVDAMLLGLNEQEKGLRALGLKTKAMYAEELKDARAALKLVTDARKDVGEAAVAEAEKKVKELEIIEKGGWEARMLLMGVKTKEMAEEELRVEMAKLYEMLANEKDLTEDIIAEQQARVNAARVAAGQTALAFKVSYADINASITGLGQSFGGLFGQASQAAGTMKAGWGDALQSMAGGMGANVAAGEQMQSAFKGMQAGWKGTEKIVDGVKTMDKNWGSMAQSAASGAMAVAGGIQNVMKATDTLSTKTNVLGGMMAGAQAGMAFGPWGAAVGAAAGAITGFFRNRGAKKVAKQIGTDYGVEVSTELAKTIDKESKKLFGKDRGAASVFHLGDLIAEAGGVTEKNFTKMTEGFSKGLAFLDKGKFSTEQFKQMADKSFPALAEHAMKTGGVWTKQFSEIVKKTKDTGEEVAGLDELLTATYTKAVSGLQNIVGTFAGKITKPMTDVMKLKDEQKQLDEQILALQKEGKSVDEEMLARKKTIGTEINKISGDVVAQSQAEFDRLSRISLATFNSMVANGESTIDAIGAIGPSIDILAEAAKGLGFEGNAAFAELSRFRELATTNQPLLESVGGLNDLMTALANLGALNQETFEDLKQQGVMTFQSLVDSGFTEKEAMQQMKPMLETIRQLYDDKKIAIDEGTLAMIRQAEENGVLAKKEESTQEVLKDGISALIKALKGDLPAAWKESAKAAEKAAEDMKGGMKGVEKQLGDAGKAAYGWSSDMVKASAAAAAAVKEVALGASPGGVREISTQFKLAEAAAKSFHRSIMGNMAQTKVGVDAATGVNGSGGGGGSMPPITIQIPIYDAAGRERARHELHLDLQQALDNNRLRIPRGAMANDFAYTG